MEVKMTKIHYKNICMSNNLKKKGGSGNMAASMFYRHTLYNHTGTALVQLQKYTEKEKISIDSSQKHSTKCVHNLYVNL